MYPFVRLAKEILNARRQPKLPFDGTHISHHICWPWDIDMFGEMNNGRVLSIYDLGRIPLAFRIGLSDALRQNRWGLTMAGCSVRWRARVRPFARFEMQSRCLGWDDKFCYLEQTMWLKDGRCASQALYRAAVTDAQGIVPPARVTVAMGIQDPSPELPRWATAWIEADATRAWPPERKTQAA